MEETPEVTSAPVAENTEPTSASAEQATTDQPASTEPTQEEKDAAAALVLAAAGLEMIAAAEVMVEHANGIQHTAHLTDGPPW